MTPLEFLDAYILYIVGATLVFYFTHGYIDGQRNKLDGSLIDSLNNIAQELDAGNAIETSIMTISKDKSNPSAKYFKEIIKEANRGLSFQQSLQAVGKRTKSRTFAYICDILYLAQGSKANIADSLKKLSTNLWEIDHLQTSISSKASAPITTLKALGIIIIPLIYYMMSTLLSSGTMVIAITTPFKIYFFAVATFMTLTDYFLFSDIKEGLYTLPFTLSFITLVVLKLGPLIANYFVG
jgi:Flp pilus assembly protein TadB